MFVHVGQPRAGLVDQSFDSGLGQSAALVLDAFVHLEHVLVCVLEDQEELVVLPQGLLQFDDVLVVQLPERLDLSEADAFVPARVFPFELFYGHKLLRRHGLSEINYAERARVDFLLESPFTLKILYLVFIPWSCLFQFIIKIGRIMPP